MKRKLALLHTSPLTLSVMGDLAERHLPDVEMTNLLDDSLIQELIDAETVTPQVEKRIATYLDLFEEAGVDGVLCCCSSVGEVVDRMAESKATPVYRVDRPMAQQAVREGSKVGVIATLRSTLEPTVRLVEKEAKDLGKQVEIESVLVDGAFLALNEGRRDTHDRLVKEALHALIDRVDVVLLAQASMARVLEGMEKPSKPVLSSPESGLLAAGKAVRSTERRSG